MQNIDFYKFLLSIQNFSKKLKVSEIIYFKLLAIMFYLLQYSISDNYKIM